MLLPRMLVSRDVYRRGMRLETGCQTPVMYLHTSCRTGTMDACGLVEILTASESAPMTTSLAEPRSKGSTSGLPTRTYSDQPLDQAPPDQESAEGRPLPVAFVPQLTLRPCSASPPRSGRSECEPRVESGHITHGNATIIAIRACASGVRLVRRQEAYRVAVGFTAAVLLNLLFLAALLLEKVTTEWVAPMESAPPVQVLLQQAPAFTPSARKQRTSEGAEPAMAQRPLPPQVVEPDRPTLPSNPAQSSPSVATSPSPVPVSPASPDATADGERARTASALQHLRACSNFGFQAHSEAHCGKGWGDGGADVDALSPTARATFSAESDSVDARLQRSNAVRGALVDHSGGGSNFHYGCTLKHGKVECSTY